MIIRETAKPKINLSLRVLGRRADGYHTLESLVTFARGIGDRLTLQPELPTAVEVRGPMAEQIAGENLVARAIDLLRDANADLEIGKVSLDKHLPVAAGVGGGSADAAALLRAVRRANQARGVPFDWEAIARRLGADVCVCVANRTSIMWGVGYNIERGPALPKIHAVLANAMIPVPSNKTAAVFAELDAGPAPDERRPSGWPARFHDLDALVEWLAEHPNTLTPAAVKLMSSVPEMVSALQACPGCLIARMSGAGPTCFGVFGSADAADSAAQAISIAHPSWWVRAVELGDGTA